MRWAYFVACTNRNTQKNTGDRLTIVVTCNIRIPKIPLHISTKTLKYQYSFSLWINMDEHVVQNDCDLQLSSSTLEGNFNYAPHLAESTLYQHITKAEDCDSYSAPQWIGYQQMPPYYVEYLVGNGISDMQGEIPHDTNGIGCSFTSEESFLSMEAHQVRQSRCQHEEILANNFRNTQHQICYQKQGPEEGLDTAAPNMSGITTSRRTYMRQKATDADRRRRTRIAASLDALEDLLPQSKEKQGPEEGLDTAAPNMSGITTSRRTYMRQKATDADRRRRTRIAASLDALEDLLPQSKEGNKTNIVDDCIEYIKYLQLHMKELSQNRLVGEPTSNHLTYLEGYGAYLVDEKTATASGPLQEMLGNLMETSPSAAIKLLESRGLYMMPINARSS
ncbi:unnamed protein product [Lactuca virosa]|uniref:BHLH domain-containing protein n=1 Tax=Lactuca virosa TaxID=75947 RepID=A0AAU9PAY6_9ASTR|nr:unnamed protein product [Lactuca virosa]